MQIFVASLFVIAKTNKQTNKKKTRERERKINTENSPTVHHQVNVHTMEYYSAKKKKKKKNEALIHATTWIKLKIVT